MNKLKWRWLKYVDMPHYIKNRTTEYLDGYTYSLYKYKLITEKQLTELRKMYWEKPFTNN